MNILFGKYREIIIAVALFLVFDTGVLILNFIVANQIKNDAVAVNLAGRQRMLSQRTVKSLLEVQNNVLNDNSPDKALSELKNTYSTFDKTLEAFISGGETLSGSGKPIYLAAADSPNASQALAQAKSIWTPYKTQLNNVFENIGMYQLENALSNAIQYASANNLKLLKLMNDLTSELENIATEKANKLRFIQTIGIGLALLNFIFILYHFINKLQRSDHLAESARRETTEILDTVNEGLFLLDREFIIGTQHSKSLNRILQNQQLSGENFLSLLGKIVPKQTINVLKDYIDLLFGDRANEILIKDLNPVNEVEVHFSNQSGGYEQRYLEFAFHRVIINGTIPHLLVSIRDITNEIQLRNELNEARTGARSQIDLLLNALHISPGEMSEFLNTVEIRLNKINDILKERNNNQLAMQDKLERIFTLAHAIKGDASALSLESYELDSHNIETLLQELRGKGDLDGTQFIPVTIKLDSMMRHVSLMRQLASRFSELNIHHSSANKLNENTSWRELQSMAGKISTEHGKQIQLLENDVVNSGWIPEIYKRPLLSATIQLIRNAIVHGIETPEERITRGKDKSGTIIISRKVTKNNRLALSIYDDGRGICPETIRKQLVSSGKYDTETVEAMDTRKLISKIFEPGFSTAIEINQNAGRGVGMNVIRDQIKEIDSSLRIHTRPGKYCEFLIELPLEAEVRAA